jgi:hypothetical protein
MRILGELGVAAAALPRRWVDNDGTDGGAGPRDRIRRWFARFSAGNRPPVPLTPEYGGRTRLHRRTGDSQAVPSSSSTPEFPGECRSPAGKAMTSGGAGRHTTPGARELCALPSHASARLTAPPRAPSHAHPGATPCAPPAPPVTPVDRRTRRSGGAQARKGQGTNRSSHPGIPRMALSAPGHIRNRPRWPESGTDRPPAEVMTHRQKHPLTCEGHLTQPHFRPTSKVTSALGQRVTPNRATRPKHPLADPSATGRTVTRRRALSRMP